MKLVVSPEFSSKFVSLSSDAEIIGRLGRIVAAMDSAGDKAEVIDALRLGAAPLENEVYVVRVGDARIFLSFGTDSGEEYVILLDLALTKAPTASLAPVSRNPKFNSLLNPNMNSALNPKFNSALNPKFNSAINPKFNSAINPKLNSAINPKFNSAINPKFNSAINPRFNSAINPRFNSTINPRFNSTYAGPFLYDLSLEREGYMVRANENTDVMFDDSGEMIGIAVRNSSNGFALFDNTGEWVGYLVPTDQEGFLRFSPDADWTGMVI